MQTRHAASLQPPNLKPHMTIAAHTLGCKLNYAETSDILRRLAADGHTVVDWGRPADLYIINTCTVTAVAEKKCRTAIRQAHRLNPEAEIVVMGCFAQVAAKEIAAIPGVTLVLGNDRKHLLPQMLKSSPACGGDLGNPGNQAPLPTQNPTQQEISKICTAPDGQQTDTTNKNDFQDLQDLAQRENEQTDPAQQKNGFIDSAQRRSPKIGEQPAASPTNDLQDLQDLAQRENEQTDPTQQKNGFIDSAQRRFPKIGEQPAASPTNDFQDLQDLAQRENEQTDPTQQENGYIDSAQRRFPKIGEQPAASPRNDFQDLQDLAQREPTAFPLQYSFGDRTRTFFKIQDGCDYFCTYCAIPFARGRSRSATIEETLCAARRIADEGAREVVLTGVNTGTFGQHQGESFLDLLRGLDAIEGIQRYRISSIEPNLLTDDILRFVASSRAFLPHFHIPLQAGSDHVLALMRRRYDTALYRAKLVRIKELMPDACIAADIMAGFNGENEEEFRKTLAFVDSLPISYLHVFTYSDRPGTAALRLAEKVPVAVRHEHTARLLELSERKHNAFIASQLGASRPVLWESSIKSEVGGRKSEVKNNLPPQTSNLLPPTSYLMEGWTDNYIRVCAPYDEALVGSVSQVILSPDNIVRD